jgi:hypothetical protein
MGRAGYLFLSIIRLAFRSASCYDKLETAVFSI